MLALVRPGGLSPCPFEGCEGEYLEIKPIGVRRWVRIASIVHLFVVKSSNQVIDEFRIDQRTVAGDTNYDIRRIDLRRLIITIQYIIFTALEHREAKQSHMLHQFGIPRVRRGRQNDPIESPGAGESFK